MKRMFGILALMVVISIMIAGCVQPEGNETVTPTPETPGATETPLETEATATTVETGTPEETGTTPATTETTATVTEAETETPPPPSIGAETILITESGYSPDPLTIPVNTTVIWTNNAVENQSIAIAGPSGTIDLDMITPGDSVDYTFTEQGNYAYVSPETGLEGTINVVENTTT